MQHSKIAEMAGIGWREYLGDFLQLARDDVRAAIRDPKLESPRGPEAVAKCLRLFAGINQQPARCYSNNRGNRVAFSMTEVTCELTRRVLDSERTLFPKK